jgi:membrane protease YdiL (CAAX protease family)
MPDPTLSACLLAGALAVVGLAMSPFERWAYRAGAGAPLKVFAYGGTMVLLWSLAAAAVWIYGEPRLLEAPGPAAAWLPAPALAGPVLGGIAAAYFVLGFLPLIQSLRGLRQRRAYAAAMRRELAGIPGLLPNTAGERAAWIALSLTAGVCEEILFRGFLIRFLHEGPLALPLAGALAASTVVFGLGHAYQGFKGVVTTATGGVAFGLLFLLSGSLVPCIILHALLDLQVAYVLRPTPAGAPGVPEAA